MTETPQRPRPKAGIGFWTTGVSINDPVRPLAPSLIQVWNTDPAADRIILSATEARTHATALMQAADELDRYNHLREENSRIWARDEAIFLRSNSYGAVAA